MGCTTLLLAARSRFAGQRLPKPVAHALGRANRLSPGQAGESEQLKRHFELLPRSWPVAALTRQRDADDAALSAWLRADPAYIRPDISGARLLAHGDTLALTREDVAALLPALKPLFGDAGFPIDAPVPARWYLRLPKEAKLPPFVEPADALGTDLFDHLAGFDSTETAANNNALDLGRRWRALLSEAQVVLHNHPVNARRVAAGQLPVNSLWFWGGGSLPDHVSSSHARVHSDDELVQGLAASAGVESVSLPARFPVTDVDALFDLRHIRDVDALARDWLLPAIVMRAERGRMLVDCADGMCFELTGNQRWRFWRKPVTTLDA